MTSSKGSRLSLDEIGEILNGIETDSSKESESVEDFYKRVEIFYPQIKFQSTQSHWDDEDEQDEIIVPLWWDDLDEPFVLDKNNWLTQINKTELLTPEKTRELMSAIEAGVYAEATLDGEMYPELLLKHGKDELTQIAQVGRRANDEMVTGNLKLVLHVARKYARQVGIEDAFSFGVFGLLQAVKKFDWRLGNQFSTYATWWLRQSMSREIADSNTTIDIPVHAVEMVNAYAREMRAFVESEFPAAGEVIVKENTRNTQKIEPSFQVPKFEYQIENILKSALEASAPSYDFWDVYVEAPSLLEKYETTDLAIEDFDFKDIADDLVKRLTNSVLSQRELEVLLSRHGIFTGEPMTLEQIGNRLGLTRERIRQIERRSILKLERFLEGVKLDNYWEKIEHSQKIYELKIDANVSLKLPFIIRAECGKVSGYRQHRKNNEESCQACRQAHVEFKRIYENRKPKAEKLKNKRIGYSNNLKTANDETRAISAPKQVRQVRWALEHLKLEPLTDSMRASANARIDYPEASLSELAVSLGDEITKDMVAGNLRRLVKLAVKHSGEQAPVDD